MTEVRKPPVARLKLAGWIALAGLGCSVPEAPNGIVPDAALGRRVVEAAMASWMAGRPTGAIEGTSPRFQVVDTHRKPGQRLEGFEILAASPDDRFLSVSIRLTLADPDERPVVRYLAVGVDPVLLFRREDYDLLMHWEHRMDPAPDETADTKNLPPG